VIDSAGQKLAYVYFDEEPGRRAAGKQHGTMRKTKHRGLASVATDFMLNLIAYNLIRIPKLLAA
jgi:hypothetical protein